MATCKRTSKHALKKINRVKHAWMSCKYCNLMHLRRQKHYSRFFHAQTSLMICGSPEWIFGWVWQTSYLGICSNTDPLNEAPKASVTPATSTTSTALFHSSGRTMGDSAWGMQASTVWETIVLVRIHLELTHGPASPKQRHDACQDAQPRTSLVTFSHPGISSPG